MKKLLLLVGLVVFLAPSLVYSEWKGGVKNEDGTYKSFWGREVFGEDSTGCSQWQKNIKSWVQTPNSKRCKKYKKEQLEKEKQKEKQCGIVSDLKSDDKNNLSVYVLKNKIITYTQPTTESSKNDSSFYPYGGDFDIGPTSYHGYEIIEERIINDKKWIQVCKFNKGGGKTWIDLEGEEKSCETGWGRNKSICGWTDRNDELILYSSFFSNEDSTLENQSLEERLKKLKDIFEKDLISKEEYDKKRKEILDEM